MSEVGSDATRLTMDRPLIWSESLVVGHDELDKDHRRLVMLINELCTSYGATRDTAESTRALSALMAAADQHVRHETLVLREFSRRLEEPRNLHPPHHLKAIVDAAIDDHIADHEILLDRLAEVARRVDRGLFAEGASLCQEVEKWFLDHAIEYDLRIKAIVHSMRPYRARR